MEEQRRRASNGAMFTSLKCPPGPGLDSTCQLPLGMLYSPFCSESMPATAACVGQGLPPVLCLTCLAYINLYAKVVDPVKGLWQCALCGARNVAQPSLLTSNSSSCNDPVLVAPMYEFQQPLQHYRDRQQSATSSTQSKGSSINSSGNSTDTMTIVLVVDANLPPSELQALGQALRDLQQDPACLTRWGLVVFDEAVAVYQLGISGIAAADIFVRHEELTDELLQSQEYLAADDAALHMIQTCLAALAVRPDDENAAYNNNTNTAPGQNMNVSRLERLKRAKAARQRRQAPASGNSNDFSFSVASDMAVLEQSPWMQARLKSKQRETASRCTGEALQAAMDLTTAGRGSSRTSRVWLFTNGCPSLGDGTVVLEESNINSNTKTRTIDTFQMARAVEFYKVLSQTAMDEGLVVDVFCTGVAELGLAAYQALVEPSAGYALVHETYQTPHLQRHLQYILEHTYVSHSRVRLSSEEENSLEECLMDVRFSSFLTPTHFVGPGELVTDQEKSLLPNERSAFAMGSSLAAQCGLKTNNLPRKDMLETCLTRFKVGRVDPLSTFSFMFQLNDFFQKDSFAFFQCVSRHLNRRGTHLVTRVTTHRLPVAKDVGEFLDAVDEEVIPVVLAKEAVYRCMHGREVEGVSPDALNEEQLEQLAIATQLDLDATVARVSNAYRLLGLQEGRRGLDLTEEGGVRAAGSSLDFAFPPELGEALKRLYHLRRGPLLSPGPMRSTDDRLQLRSLFLRFPLEESLLSMAPCLWALFDSVLHPVPVETLALWDSSVIAADNFHTVFIWSGRKADREGGQEYCREFLANRSSERFPMPDLHILTDGDSMSRRFTALLSPSHGDPIDHSLANFPGLDRLAPDELTSLRSKFPFYDASTDPSFRSWFWTIASATSTSKDEGWSLCE